MEKLQKLKELLRSYGKAAVAFSGGVDSSFLLKVAFDTLGKDNVVAITLKAAVNPTAEMWSAAAYAKELGVEFIQLDADVFSIPGFTENLPDRCYTCKKSIFTRILETAAKKGINIILDGTNADDDNDYRPGMKALEELGVKSPLKLSGLTKEEIRRLSKELEVPTWNKPSKACLASRIPYHEPITPEKLRMVEAAEEYLMGQGFIQVRVRCHGNLARIELAPEELERFFDMKFMQEAHKRFKEIGFSYTALDLAGYRTGSLNEMLNGRAEV